MKTSNEIRQDFLQFWTNNPRNAQVVPNMSLVPNVDSTLLFVNSGMFPLAPYLGGQPHPLGTRLVNIQRCLRTNYDEMLEVGDNRHTLMFEMMGNWSLGDFTKEEQIPWVLELLVEKFGLDPKRLYVSVFAGDEDAPRDQVAIDTWIKAFQKYGVDAEFSEEISNVPANIEEGKNWKPRIFPYEKKKNWWERAHSAGELGGPTSEMFYDMGEIVQEQDKYHINDDSGRFIEIGNNVFMEFKLDSDLKWQPLEQKNIDFGGGFERINMIAQGKKDIFETDIYEPVIKKVEEISGKQYKEGGKETEITKYFRILADHSRAATFILADGVTPSNKDQGYILRRFIRRLVRFGLKLGITQDFTKELAIAVIEKMHEAYPHLKTNQNFVIDEIDKEEIKFRRTLEKGLGEMDSIWHAMQTQANTHIGSIKNYHDLKLSIYGTEKSLGELMFYVYETYGFPPELFLDQTRENIEIDKVATQKIIDGVRKMPDLIEEDENLLLEDFRKVEQQHREASRAGAEQKFKGGLADQSVETTKLHTAHHLLLAALQKLVDPNIKQRGSNITSERLRIDFNLDRKLEDDEVKKVEDLVNEQIEKALPVVRKEMKKEEAEKLGAQMEFGAKYPEIVSVYLMGNEPDYFSMEFCGGPHVSNTSELGESGKKFKILKQESSGAGIRRIKAGLV